ncbi:hypothetical protein KAURM247S_04346 [Kitasatospora aureofaciens]
MLGHHQAAALSWRSALRARPAAERRRAELDGGRRAGPLHRRHVRRALPVPLRRPRRVARDGSWPAALHRLGADRPGRRPPITGLAAHRAACLDRRVDCTAVHTAAAGYRKAHDRADRAVAKLEKQQRLEEAERRRWEAERRARAAAQAPGSAARRTRAGSPRGLASRAGVAGQPAQPRARIPARRRRGPPPAGGRRPAAPPRGRSPLGPGHTPVRGQPPPTPSCGPGPSSSTGGCSSSSATSTSCASSAAPRPTAPASSSCPSRSPYPVRWLPVSCWWDVGGWPGAFSAPRCRAVRWPDSPRPHRMPPAHRR